MKYQASFRIVVTLLCLLWLTGCAARAKSKPGVSQMVIPRECMGAATFYAGECEPVNATEARCKGVDMTLPIECVKVKK